MKVCLVTGGSRGIGKGIVKRFCDDGNFVYFTYAKNEALARAIEGEIGLEKCKGIQCDNLNEIQVQAVIEMIKTEKQNIDILVNNAGITKDNWFGLMAFSDFKSVVDTNLLGTVCMTKAVIKTMISQKSGVIVNLSSIAGIMGTEGQTNYASSKAGIIAFTKSLAREVGKNNIRVVAVAPGFIDTDMYAKIPIDMKKKKLESVSLKRPGNVEEVASLVSYLSSDQASYITGTVITIDGGLL